LAEFRYFIRLKKKVYLLAVRPSQKYWLSLDSKTSYKIKLNKKVSDPAKNIGLV
jgi:hypothetical protein